MSGGLLVILGDRHSPLLFSFLAVSEVTHLSVAVQYLRICAATILGRRMVRRGEAFEMYSAALVLFTSHRPDPESRTVRPGPWSHRALYLKATRKMWNSGETFDAQRASSVAFEVQGCIVSSDVWKMQANEG